jgi:hypothetical protein
VLFRSASIDETLWEISPETENKVIQEQENGIEFKFCLLNEVGEAATEFDEGENYTFSFSIENKEDDTITVTTEFITADFYRVYRTQDNKDLGKPWTGLWCEFSLRPREIKSAPAECIKLDCPWVLNGNNRPDYPLCMSESKYPLSKGNYYTSFALDFHYTINNEEKKINNKRFKINFQIQ